MIKKPHAKEDFIMTFFDYIEEPQSDLTAIKDNIKYKDTFTIFKIDKDSQKKLEVL